MKRLILVLFCLLIALPVQAQLIPADIPPPPDTTYLEGDILAGRLERSHEGKTIVLHGWQERGGAGGIVEGMFADYLWYLALEHTTRPRCTGRISINNGQCLSGNTPEFIANGRYLFRYIFQAETEPHADANRIVMYLKRTTLFKELGYLELNGDKHYLKDATDCPDIALPDSLARYVSWRARPRLSCWTTDKVYFREGKFTSFKFVGPIAYPKPPALFSFSLTKAAQRFSGGKPVAGEVWLSFPLPAFANTSKEQLRLEKLHGIYYQYRVTRDGDNEWVSFSPSQSSPDGIEVFRTPFGVVYVQRRRYLIKDLNPTGEYSFCVRAVNLTGTNEEVCTTDKITPVFTESAELPAAVTLAQNYPNPFNPSTAIRYEIADIQHVRLEAFNTLGQSVGVLVDGVRPPGSHTVRFDASGLPSGLYVYRLSVGSQTLTRTMLLSR